MTKKLKKNSKIDSAKKQQKRKVGLLKKPNLESFLSQASDWYDKWGYLCPQSFTKSVYLDYQKMFYMSTINDMTEADYNKFVAQQSKNVIDRFNKIIKK